MQVILMKIKNTILCRWFEEMVKIELDNLSENPKWVRQDKETINMFINF